MLGWQHVLDPGPVCHRACSLRKPPAQAALVPGSSSNSTSTAGFNALHMLSPCSRVSVPRTPRASALPASLQGLRGKVHTHVVADRLAHCN